MEQKFYICKHCGNIIAKVKDTGVPVICCGEPMSEIVPGTTDAAVEKHVPVVKAEGSQVTVTVGAVEHPMLPEHFIYADSRAEGVEFQTILSASRLSDIFFMRLSVASVVFVSGA